MSGGQLSRLAVVTDEIDPDPGTACRVARELGMEAVDLNSLWGRPVTELEDAEVAALDAVLRSFRLRPHMIGGLPFKALAVAGRSPEALLCADDFAHDLGLLERSLAIGRRLGAACARVHAFAWPPGTPARRPGGGEIPADVLPAIAAGLRAACDLAGRYGLALGLENVRASYGNSGRNLAAVCRAVGDARLQVVWDPANAYVSGEDDAATLGYRAVRPFVRHVHVKDARLADPARPEGPTAWECIGRGAVGWAVQLRALRADGYRGLLCVETHWRLPGRGGEAATREALSALLRLREEALA